MGGNGVLVAPGFQVGLSRIKPDQPGSTRIGGREGDRSAWRAQFWKSILPGIGFHRLAQVGIGGPRI